MRKIIIFFTIIYFLCFASPCLAKGINFSFVSYNGKKHELIEFRGKYVIINFFSSYCDGCIAELQVLNRIQQKCEKNIQVISLLLDPEGIVFLRPLISNLNYIVGFANKKILKIFPDFNITPTTYILSPEGEKLLKITGFKPYKDFITLLNKYTSCN